MNGSNLISNLYAQKEKLLRNFLADFTASLNLFPQFGIELEFYLRRSGVCPPAYNMQCEWPDAVTIDDYIIELQTLFPQIIIEKEQGKGQIEIKTHPTPDLARLAQDIENIKSSAKNLASKKKLIADFSSQPFIDDCGSAMQFNFSLHDKQNKNLFMKKDDLFFQSIAGMLDLTEEIMVFCAPKNEDYLRYDIEINRALHKKGKYTAPVNICFGNNNRTALIRLPRCDDKAQSRIEFRAAAADADPYLVLTCLLFSIKNGIEKKTSAKHDLQVFGNAFDLQYNNLKRLPQDLARSESVFLANSTGLKGKFELVLT